MIFPAQSLSGHQSPPAPAPSAPATDVQADPLLAPLIHRVFENDPEYRHYANGAVAAADPAALQDFLFATDATPMTAAEAFARLRWGGQLVFASRNAKRVAQAAVEFNDNGFSVERAPATIRTSAWPLLSLFAPRLHYVVARKVLLTPPGEFSDRFTYHVELVRHGQEHVVLKRVPTFESVVGRLRHRFPDLSADTIEKRAHKFTDKIFPTFLTREAAILKILQAHLPSRYADRVPHVVELEKDIRGFVRSFKMNWLRNGGPPLTQLQFATQAADLLRALHDSAGVLHLDLRLDNMVITENGVGFVDFGSAVRETEDLASNPLLKTLFEDLMRTSHIQRMLFHMTRSGQVTAEHLCNQQGKADKGIDLFYLALQFTTPHANPDLVNLIQFDPNSEMARKIAALSQAVLRPTNPTDANLKTAKEILRSLEMIESEMAPAAA